MRIKWLFCLGLIWAGCSQAPPVRTFVRQEPLIIDRGEPVYFRIQVFALYDQEEAANRARELKVLQDEPVMLIYQEPYWKIIVGDFNNRRKAEQIKNGLINLGYIDAWIVQVQEKELILEKKHTF
jgi:hypothetical protein